MPLLCGTAEPLHGFDVILRDLNSKGVHAPKVVLRIWPELRTWAIERLGALREALQSHVDALG